MDNAFIEYNFGLNLPFNRQKSRNIALSMTLELLFVRYIFRSLITTKLIISVKKMVSIASLKKVIFYHRKKLFFFY